MTAPSPELTALIACPFCDGRRIEIIVSTQGFHGWCNDCATRGPIADRRDLAATLWNTRTAVRSGVDEDAELDAECERILNISDDELDAELRAQGHDPEQVAEEARQSAEFVLSEFRAFRKWEADRAPEDVTPFAAFVARARLSAETAETWRPIETATRDNRTILACIWHGTMQHIVKAKWASKTKAWIDADGDSHVAWVEGKSRPAFYMELPEPPATPQTGET